MEGAPSAQSSLIGATIGNYRVVAKLGEGGMGAVYLAEHPLIGKKVALKVLHEEYSANQDVVSRFFNEAKAVNDIQHPNIVDIIDYGVVKTPEGRGFVYFIMEFLAGESLAALVQRESPLPPERVFAIGMQVADALAASHGKGIIHRDLKPDNIYVMQRGRERDFVKVLDFGIAKLTGDQPGSRRTRTGIVMGTPAYMSPEQCEGKGNIDLRTDIYALGIVLYEMLTGRVPFAGEGYGEVLVQHLTKRPERPTTPAGLVPPYVEAVVMKTLEKKREDRYQSMEELIEALRDPQGFVDARGGLSAFLAPSDGTYGTSGAAGESRTPYPGLPMATPGTGMQRPPSVVSAGAVTSMSGDVEPPRSKAPLVVTGVAAAVLIAAAGIFFATRGDDKPAPAPIAQNTPPEPQVKPAEPQVKPPEPVDVAPKTITVSVSTTPAGAEIFLAGEDKPRGVSPLDLELPRGEGTAQLVLRRAGHVEATRTVKLSVDAQLDVALAAEPKVASKPERPNKPAGGKPAKPPGGKPDKPAKPGDAPHKPGADDVLEPTF